MFSLVDKICTNSICVFKRCCCCLRWQVKVILTDVLQTEVGRNYLMTSKLSSQSLLKREALKKQNVRRLSDCTDRQRKCAEHKHQKKSLPLTPNNASPLKRTRSANSDVRDASTEIKFSPAKRLKTVQQTTPTTSADKCKQSQKMLSNQAESLNTAVNKSCPGGENASLTFFSPVRSIGTDSHINESKITVTPSRGKCSERRGGKQIHSTECKAPAHEVSYTRFNPVL